MNKALLYVILFFSIISCQHETKEKVKAGSSHNPFLTLKDDPTQIEEKDSSYQNDKTQFLDFSFTLYEQEFNHQDLPSRLELEIYHIKQEAYEKSFSKIREYAVRVHASQNLQNPPPLQDVLNIAESESISNRAKELFEAQKDRLDPTIHNQVLRELHQNLLLNEYLKLFSAQIKDIEQSEMLSIDLTPPQIPSSINLNISQFASLGDPNAPNHLILMTSYDCNHCIQINRSISRLIREYPQKFYFTLIPLSHNLDDLNHLAIKMGTCYLQVAPSVFWHYHTELVNIPNFNQLAKTTEQNKLENFKKNILNESFNTKEIKNRLESCLKTESAKHRTLLGAQIFHTLNYNDEPRYILNNRTYQMTSLGVYSDIKSLLNL